jgi:putative transposase
VSRPRRLAVGEWVRFDDEQRQVVALTGSLVHLRSADGIWSAIHAPDLICAPGFSLLSGTQAAQADSRPGALDTAALLESLPAREREELADLAAHLREVETGYRSGDPARRGPGEPRAGYDPAVVPLLADRVAAKAAELGVGAATVWRRLRRYRAQGLAGLIDGRSSRVANPLAGADPRLLDAIVAQHAVGEAQDSTGTLARFCRRLGDRLEHEHGPGEVIVPSPTTVARYIRLLLPGAHTFGPGPTRRSEASRPQRAYRPNPAVRPGQVVMIDATPLDVVAYDATTDVTHKIHLVAAIDAATRTLLAWRMTPGDTRAVDTVLLLDDAITPEPMRPGWAARLRYTMARLPIPRALDLAERVELAAARPVIWPEQILLDHAKINLSDAMNEACRRLQIELGLARQGQGTDKANIERAFGVINTDFCQHVAGYKGSSVHTRGRGIEHAARWSIDEVEEFFAEYVVGTYQQRTHSGLIVPGFPELELSPNQAYSQAVARYGFVACPPANHHYCDLLPIDYRVIRPEGIQRNKLVYDSPVLTKYRRAPSPISGKGNAWPIRYLPHDPSRIFILLDGDWQVLYWTHLPDSAQPFTARMLAQARALLAEAGRTGPSQQQIADALTDLQRRMDAPEHSTARNRRELMRARHDARTSRRDRDRAGMIEATSALPTLSAPDPPAAPIALEEIEDLPLWNPGGGR